MSSLTSSSTPFRTRLGVRFQLVGAFSLLVALAVTILGVALWGLGHVQDSAHQATEIDGRMSRLASDVGTQTLLARRYEKDFFLNIADPNARADYLTKWRQASTALDGAIEAFAAAATTMDDLQQVRQWHEESAHYTQGFSEITRGVEEGRITTPQAANAGLVPFKDSIRLLTDTSVTIWASKIAKAADAEAALQERVTSTKWQLLLTGALALAIAAVWSVVFPMRLMRPITALREATSRLANGDLTARVDLLRNDELGALALAFNQMTDTIRAQIVEQQRANEELRAASATKVAKEYLEQVVRSYSAFTHEVAQGNLTVRLSFDDNQDELSLLGSNLNNMVENLHRMTSQMQQANANIAAAAAEILAATTQQAASAAEQLAALTQTTTTIEEVKAIAAQTAQQASQVAQESQAALQVARQGTQAVEETVSGMGQIRIRVESIAQTILALAEQTQAIGAIITTVNELADQSNLLALNAAIEAARAGEQGKSFAVVAQHVRELAERSKGATGQVKQILGEIQKATNAAVLVTEEGTKGVEVGGRLAGQAGQVIHRIAAEVESGAQASVQIAAAAQQQTSGMVQIGQAMTSIQQATTQALASTRQAERAGQDLHSLAQSLQRAISVYQL